MYVYMYQLVYHLMIDWDQVPIVVKRIDPSLRKWLKSYILSRELEFLKLPLGQGRWDDHDPTLTARSSSYNLLLTGRSKRENHWLSLLRNELAEIATEYISKWQQTAPDANPEANPEAPWRKALNEEWRWTRVPAVFMQVWASVHRHVETNSSSSVEELPAWPKYSHLRAHSHAHPISGYITIDALGSDTLFRSPFFEQKLFSVKAQNGRLVLFPGGVRHQTVPWHVKDRPRISIAFNIELAPPVFWQRFLPPAPLPAMAASEAVDLEKKSEHDQIMSDLNMGLTKEHWMAVPPLSLSKYCNTGVVKRLLPERTSITWVQSHYL